MLLVRLTLAQRLPFFLRKELKSAHRGFTKKELIMSLGTILLIVVVLLLLGALPTWPYSSSWGYYPSGGLGLILIIILVLFLLGRI